MRKILIIIFCATLGFVSLYNIFQRINWDSKPIQVMYILDIDTFYEEGKIEQNVLENFKRTGLKVVTINYSDKVLEKINYLKNQGFSVILKLSPKEKYRFSEINGFIKKNKSILSGLTVDPSVYISQKEILFYNIKTFFKHCGEIIKENDFLCINYEFKNYVLSKYIDDYNNVVRGFVVDINTTNEYILKIKKAVFERSCRVVYLIPVENIDAKENIKNIMEIITGLKNKNQIVESMSITNFNSVKLNKIGNIVVLIIAVVIPLLMYKHLLELNRHSIVIKYLLVNGISVLVGIVCYGLLQDYGYMILDKEVRWIKLMFVVPILLTPFVLLSKTELKEVFDYSLKIKDFFVIIIGLYTVFYIILRTGNVEKTFILPYEINIRNMIEQVALFRPRFKEIFFGQPLLVFSLFLLKVNNKNIINKIIFGLSIISQVSIINTFLHIHTPLYLSFLRTLIGIIGGFVIGMICILMYKRVVRFK